ncbi:MAG: NifU family protein [Bilifractor sp.]
MIMGNMAETASLFDSQSRDVQDSIYNPSAGDKNEDKKLEMDVEQVLTDRVRPYLHTHGGDIVLLSVQDGIVRFKLTGQCSGCAAADLTSEEFVKTELMQALRSVRDAVLVNEVSEDLLSQARAILRHRRDN